MSITALQPTFSCFDDAIEYIDLRLSEEPAAVKHMHLVHALCEAQDGTIYAHAWVEERGRCWSAGLADVDGQRQKIFFAIKRFDFYRAKRVKARTVYTMAQVWEQNQRHVTYGPWEPRYLERCGSDQRILGSLQVRKVRRTRL